MNREALESARAAKLLRLVRAVLATNGFYRRKLSQAGLAPERLETAAGAGGLLDRIPLTTKAELSHDQERNPPFGTNLTFPAGAYTRIHRTSGTAGRPLWWLDTPESWDWVVRAWEEVYRGAGLAEGDRVYFPFSFGPFLGFWAAFEGATRLGRLAIPAGGMTTAARVRACLDTAATVVAATPTYALHMAETAAAEGLDLAGSSVRALIVAGEPGGSVAAVKQRIEAAWGARCFDHCGMTEVGPFGFECAESPGAMHVIEDEFIVEIADPETGAVLAGPAMEVEAAAVEGELVITNLGRTASPVIRYRTGDLVRWSRSPCPCGRSWGRLHGGILGRVDDMVFIRGNNVYPSTVEDIVRRFPEVAEYRIRAVQTAALTALEIEIEPAAGPGGSRDRPAEDRLRERVAAAIERDLLFRAEVRVVPPRSLPRFELKGKRFFKDQR